MSDSILLTVKNALGLDPENTPFDITITMYINSALSNLEQLGVGPSGGFMIADQKPTWGDFLGDDKRLNNVKTYVILSVKLMFDPPPSGFAITAMEKIIAEQAWRINVTRETTHWTSPNPPPTGVNDNPLKDPVIDGGIG